MLGFDEQSNFQLHKLEANMQITLTIKNSP